MEVKSKYDIPLWGLFLGAGSFIVGIVTIGYKVVKTVGNSITELDPMKSFST